MRFNVGSEVADDHRVAIRERGVVRALALLGVLMVSACTERRGVIDPPDDGGAGDGARGDRAPGSDGLAQEDVTASDAGVEDMFVLPADAPPSSCTPEGERMHTIIPSSQVSSTDGVSYSSNPPSSGPNCGAGGSYGAYPDSQPLPRCYWINNLASGGIVLLYNCPGGCPDIVAQLGLVVRDATDPDCSSTKRIVVTPYPQMDAKVAAVAWGYTWKSGCLDGSSRRALTDFVDAHFGSNGVAPGRLTPSCK